MMQQKKRGFSLLEIMIVVAIVAILATLAIPNYIRYIQTASLTEAVTIMGEYKLSIGLYWSTQGALPVAGTTLISTPADLPFGQIVTSTPTNQLPSSIQSIQLINSGKGVVIHLILGQGTFSTLPVNNRQLALGAKPQGNELAFECGNFTANAATSVDIGFTDRAMLPNGCNYNGVSTWLTT